MRTCVRAVDRLRPACALRARRRRGGAGGAASGPGGAGPRTRPRDLADELLAAEAFGIHPGMRLGEALARCPRLALVPPDPVGVADDWEYVVSRLEAIGAAVEAERP